MNSAIFLGIIGYIMACIVGLIIGDKYGAIEGLASCYAIALLVDIRYKLEVTP